MHRNCLPASKGARLTVCPSGTPAAAWPPTCLATSHPAQDNNTSGSSTSTQVGRHMRVQTCHQYNVENKTAMTNALLGCFTARQRPIAHSDNPAGVVEHPALVALLTCPTTRCCCSSSITSVMASLRGTRTNTWPAAMSCTQEEVGERGGRSTTKALRH